MSAEATTWVVVIALAGFLTCTLGGLRWQHVLHSRADAMHRTAMPRLRSSVCDAPARLLTVDQAHRAMQLHIDCLIGECPRKAHAWHVLLDAGHVRPDSGRLHV